MGGGVSTHCIKKLLLQKILHVRDVWSLFYHPTYIDSSKNLARARCMESKEGALQAVCVVIVVQNGGSYVSLRWYVDEWYAVEKGFACTERRAPSLGMKGSNIVIGLFVCTTGQSLSPSFTSTSDIMLNRWVGRSCMGCSHNAKSRFHVTYQCGRLGGGGIHP